MLITSHVKIAWDGEVQSPDPIFNLCIKKSLHFKLKISLIINLLDLYDKIRLCSGDYSHSNKQSSEIIGHTEEGGTLESHLLYTKLQLARGIPWQKCISQCEQCSQLIWEGYHFLLQPQRPQGKPAEALLRHPPQEYTKTHWVPVEEV